MIIPLSPPTRSRPSRKRRRFSPRALPVLLACAVIGLPCARSAEPGPEPKTYPGLPTEVPATFEVRKGSFDHVRREVMIPMRDGVRLHTVILVPKTARNAPILLTRTPYDADKLTSHAWSAHLGRVLHGYDHATDVVLDGGYIRVVQDIRGKHGSEGDYVVNRPFRGPLNPTPVDHSTDTWDSIDWLTKNVPESNGRVGILGISYNGYLTLAALVDPHPALKVAVPMNPMVDGWRGDDWFHYGAFRQMMAPWIYQQVGTRKSDLAWWASHHDVFDEYLRLGSAGGLGRSRGMEQLGFWRKLVEHPAYDAFWREQAMDRLLGARPLTVPVMLVHSLWDQEDSYGALAVYRALTTANTDRSRVFLVMGPWSHGQMIEDGSSLGAIRFGTDTAAYFRRTLLRPFLDWHLVEGAPRPELAAVTAYETGSDVWRRFDTWPPRPGSGLSARPQRLHLRAGAKLSFQPAGPDEAPFEEYVSDPAKPVPFRARPIQPAGYDAGMTWSQWLVDDQREASGRTDVLSFVSETLTEPVTVRGEPLVNLVASTTGTDADWVVKLIDVYPDEVPDDLAMGGYQLMVAAEIFRGRYRDDWGQARAIAPGEPLPYRFALPHANHVFRPGHRLMVQVQSSWFPLYDRNPQTFVTNIFHARPADYRKATHRIHHAPAAASFLELPVSESR
jgi:putative CocE/NonD family hydrolase